MAREIKSKKKYTLCCVCVCVW